MRRLGVRLRGARAERHRGRLRARGGGRGRRGRGISRGRDVRDAGVARRGRLFDVSFVVLFHRCALLELAHGGGEPGVGVARGEVRAPFHQAQRSLRQAGVAGAGDRGERHLAREVGRAGGHRVRRSARRGTRETRSREARCASRSAAWSARGASELPSFRRFPTAAGAKTPEINGFGEKFFYTGKLNPETGIPFLSENLLRRPPLLPRRIARCSARSGRGVKRKAGRHHLR